MTIKQYTGYAAAGLVVFFIVQRILIAIRDARMRRLLGCGKCAPIVQKDPILGLDLVYDNLMSYKNCNSLEQMMEGHIKNGHTVEGTLMGQRLIVTTEKENIQAMLATQFKDYDLGKRRYDAFFPLLGNGIFTADGAYWEHSRQLVRPNFARAQVADLDTFEVHIGRLIDQIPKDGRTEVDLQELFFRLTLDSACEFLFGAQVNSLLGTGDEEFADAFNYSQSTLMWRTRMGEALFLYYDPKFNKSCKIVHEFADRFVRQALSEKGQIKDDGRYVFLRELAKATQDPKELRDQLLNILLAGRDTTASLLSNTMFEVAKRPEVWAKLRAEVATLGSQRPTFEQIKDLKYLKAVLNESLRLYPPVPQNARTSNKDTTLPRGGGPDGQQKIFVPKDTVIMYTIWATHRRPDYFGADAAEFKPERWETLKPGWEYLPFNGGPRICVGQQFALTEASYTMIRLLQEFKSVESRNPGPWREGLTVTCCSKDGARVVMTPA